MRLTMILTAALTLVFLFTGVEVALSGGGEECPGANDHFDIQTATCVCDDGYIYDQQTDTCVLNDQINEKPGGDQSTSLTGSSDTAVQSVATSAYTTSTLPSTGLPAMALAVCGLIAAGAGAFLVCRRRSAA